jgi:hypothetical protein
VASHPVTLKLFYDGVYNDVSSSVSQVDSLVVQHGGSEVSEAPRASVVSFAFEDPTGKYRPYLPTSVLYGKAGRNTPLQITDGGYFEVASWAPDQTVGFNASPLRGRRWTEVEAAGPLRRVGGWTEPIASATTRALTDFTALTDFWSLEDERDARQLSNPYGTDGTYNNNGLGDQDSPLGGSTSYKLNGYSDIFGFFDPSGSATSWQVCFAFKLVTQPSSATYEQLFSLSAGPSGLTTIWNVNVNQDSYEIQVFDQSSTLVDQTVSYGTSTPDNWTIMRLQGSISGGTLSWGIGWATETVAAVGTSGTVAATALGKPYSWSTASNPDDYFDGSNWAYIAATTDQSPDLIGTDVSNAFGGYFGETTGTRFLRLCSEEGLTGTVEGTSGELMGAQRPDTFLKLLQEIRDTDGGYLVDDRTQLGLYLRSRKSIYAQTTDLALTYGINVGPPLKPILDDLNTHNIISVTNRAGGTVVVEDSTSSMGSAAPPTGVGKAKQDIAVNLRNASRMTDVANWWLNMGTLPDVRYPSVTVDLDANSSLETTAVAIKAGDRITITSLDPDVVDLLVVGTLDKRDNQKRRTVTFTCVPYRQYDVAIYIASGTPLASTQKRYDSRTSTTNATSTATVTTIVATFTDSADAWSTVSVPYDWVIAGERITVTAMGAVTGAGPYTQSATVTRSVNGVSKTHAAGETIHMHPDQQARYAL